VTGPWSAGEEPVSQGMPGGTVTLVEGSTFCISEPGGDIAQGQPHGLFVRDTRVLSRWALAIDGRTPKPLTVQRSEPYAATFIGHLPPRGELASSSLLVIRRRYVGNGMREDITIRNTAPLPAACMVTLTAAADFADLFEVKRGQTRAEPPARVVAAASTLTFQTRRGERDCALLIQGDGQPEATSGTMSWRPTVPARGEWTVSIEAAPVVDGVPLEPHHPRGQPVEHAVPARRLREWRRSAPQVHTVEPHLTAVLRRSVEDIGALRIFDPGHPGRAVVAAGAPWFMALFGRDSLLTSWMLLPWDDSLALGTLQTLADRQGHVTHPASEEEPGRILHEVRFGPSASLALGGRSAYYGTADATPLFVMVLGELRRWGRHNAAAENLLPHADRALDWIERYGDADGDGFIEYSRKTGQGLAHQGWKDSWDGINFADGRTARPPHRPGRGPGILLRRLPGPRRLRPGSRRRARRPPLGRQGRPAQARLQPGVLAARQGLVRRRARPRQAAGGRAHVQHRALPVDRHRRCR